MPETTLRNALDGARAVVFSDRDDVFVVWSGGVTYNVYTTRTAGRHPVAEVNIFSVSDEKGNPLDRDEAVEHMNDHLERMAESMREP